MAESKSAIFGRGDDFKLLFVNDKNSSSPSMACRNFVLRIVLFYNGLLFAVGSSMRQECNMAAYSAASFWMSL
jgi:hypothetical protein